MAGAAPPAFGACLQGMPYEVLMRILSHASAGGGLSAETLFRLGGLCSSLRRACGSVEDSALAVPMAAPWARVVINLVDPAAALLAEFSARHGMMRSPASCYIAHARPLGGWYQLLHALAERYCTACGDVTRTMAWRDDESQDAHARFGLCRCCADCTPPEAMYDDSDDDAADSSAGLRRCAVVNVQFWSAVPKVVLDAADWEFPADKLKEHMEEAIDGDTIGLRGRFTCAVFRTPRDKAVRLLGIPAPAPYRWNHAAGPSDRPGLGIAQLRRFELDSAAELGFPSASISVERNSFEALDATWVENIYISSGPSHMGSKILGEHVYDDGVRIHSSATGELARVFCGVYAAKTAAAVSSSAVLRRCWLVAYFGTSLVVNQHCCAALLRCTITNPRYLDVFAQENATIRMRGCRVMCSGEALQEQFPFLPGSFRLSEPQHAMFTSANDIFRFARPASLAAGAQPVPERFTTYRTLFNPQRVRLLT